MQAIAGSGQTVRSDPRGQLVYIWAEASATWLGPPPRLYLFLVKV